MPPPCPEWDPEAILKAIALFGAAVAFVVGLWQYRRAQQWKRAEWVAQEMKLLFGDPVVQAVLLMIDWGSRRIPLYPDRANEMARHVSLNDDQVARALMWHEERPQGFSNLEADIRAAFDRFLDGLERFESYAETRLVKDADLRPYLSYWAEKICSANRPGAEDRLIRLRVYMQKYGFSRALRLLTRIAAPEKPSRLP